jgi:hypothetical protein
MKGKRWGDFNSIQMSNFWVKGENSNYNNDLTAQLLNHSTRFVNNEFFLQ